MNKNLLLLLVGLRLFSLPCTGSETAKLLENTENALPERARYSSSVVEKRDDSLKKIESFSLLQSRFAQNWREDFRALDEIAPNETRKAIYFKAAQALSRKEYLDFLLKASNLTEEGKLSKQQFDWALRPTTSHLRGFWTDKIPDQSLESLIERCKVIFADDPIRLEFFDGVLSGKISSEAKEFHRSYQGPANEERPTRKNSHQNRPNDERDQRDRVLSLRWIFSGILAVVIVFFLYRFLRR